MNVLSDMLSSAVVQRLGWTLLHSVWQFGLIAVLLSALLAALRRRSANTRYLTACIGLVAMLTTSTATYWWFVACPTAELAVTTVADEAPPAERFDVRDEVVPDDFKDSPSFVSPVLPDNAPSTAFAAEPALVGNSGTSSDAEGPAPGTLPHRIAEGLAPSMPWVSLAWLCGVILVSVRHLGGWVGVQRLRWVGTTKVGPDLSERALQLMDRMRISQPVRVLQSTLAELPIVVGWLRPVVLLPASLLTGLSPKQLEAILAHELAHVRRHDYLVNLLQTAAETLLFYHPAVWWLSRRIRIEREHCCDDVAVAVCGNKVDYAEALAAVEQRRAAALAMAVGVHGRTGNALGRVRRVLGISGEDRLRWTQAIGGSVAVVLLIGVFAGYLALANEPERNPEPPPADESVVQTGKDPEKRPGDSDRIALLVEQDEQGNAYVDAIIVGDLRAVQRLLANDPSLLSMIDNNRGKSSSGLPALQLAIKYGHPKIVELLLSKGAKADEENVWGYGSLLVAARNGRANLVKLLVDYGADVNGEKNKFRRPPLCDTSNAQVAEALIANGADVNWRDERRATPLHSIARQGITAIAGVLLGHGADINTEDSAGWTPLSMAAERGQKNMVEFLITKGADLNAKDKSGSTPLHRAVTAEPTVPKAGRKATAELLLARGADFTIHDVAWVGDVARVRKVLDGNPSLARNAHRALFAAILEGHTTILELLLDNGAKLSAKGNQRSWCLRFWMTTLSS